MNITGWTEGNEDGHVRGQKEKRIICHLKNHWPRADQWSH